MIMIPITETLAAQPGASSAPAVTVATVGPAPGPALIPGPTMEGSPGASIGPTVPASMQVCIRILCFSNQLRITSNHYCNVAFFKDFFF